MFSIRNSANAPPCCPEGGEPSRTATDAGITTEVVPLKGSVVVLPSKFDDVRMYVTGVCDGNKPVIVMTHDIFGFNSARTHYLADKFAEQGYFVVAPDFFGEAITSKEAKARNGFSLTFRDFLTIFFSPRAMYKRAYYPQHKVDEKMNHSVLPWIRERTSGKIGSIGMCWGSWAVFNFCTTEALSCGVHMHSSVNFGAKANGVDVNELMQKVKSPQLICNSKQESKELFENGEYITLLRSIPTIGSLHKVYNYENVSHGFFNRGDLRKPQVKASVDDAFEKAVEFFGKHLQ